MESSEHSGGIGVVTVVGGILHLGTHYLGYVSPGYTGREVIRHCFIGGDGHKGQYCKDNYYRNEFNEGKCSDPSTAAL